MFAAGGWKSGREWRREKEGRGREKMGGGAKIN